MRFLLLVATLVLSPSAVAYSSHQDWLWNTRAYETVPAYEADAELSTTRLDRGKGVSSSAWLQGAELQVGLLQHWMVTGLGDLNSQGDFFPGVRSRLRFLESGQMPVDLAAVGEWQRVYGDDIFFGGAVLAMEFADHSLVFNLLGSSEEHTQIRVGWRTPYFLYGVKAGLEWQWSALSAYSGVGPQLDFDAPGDLSLTVGAWFPIDSADRPWSLRLRLDYTLFPSP